MATIMHKVAGQIFVSDDYSEFKTLKGNRPVNSIKKIEESISNAGFIRNPILVNEKMEIINGQHRFEALKKLGLPIEYIIAENAGIDECQALNIGQTNWGTMDFINLYAAKGNESYLRLLRLIGKYEKEFHLEGTIYFCDSKMIPSGGGSLTPKIKNGNFSLSKDREEIADKRLSSAIALGFVDFYRQYKMNSRSYWGAIAYAYSHNDVNVKELAKRIIADPKKIIPTAKVSDQLAYFDDVYNKGKPAKSKVFMSADFLKDKYKD